MKTEFLIIVSVFIFSSIFVSNAYGSISLDKGAYTWTDKINIRIMEHNVNSPDTTVRIHTSDHELKNYKLSKAGNGLYTGQISLTGFLHDVTGDGKFDTNPRTMGNGPNNGFLESDRDDEFTISIKFGDGDEIKKTAKINWNIATVDFDRLISVHDELIHVKIHDIDMNLNPDTIDNISIHVFSDSDKAGIVINAREARDQPGLFETIFSLSSNRNSAGDHLFALSDDTVYIQYDDYTLPKPYDINEDLAIITELIPFSLDQIDDKKLEWSQASYKVKNGTSTAKIIVSDSEKNVFVDSIDTVQASVFSDSIREGIVLDLYETEKNSGIFERTFSFSDKRSAPNILYALEGDTATVRYNPMPLNSEGIFLTATTLIGSTGPPLERAPAHNARMVDSSGNSINYPVVGEQIQIASDIANGQSREQKFAYLVMIQDATDTTVSLAWIDGTLNPLSSFSPAASWIPQKEGDYVATMFVWESINNPTALSPPIQTEFTVVQESSEKAASNQDDIQCVGEELCISETVVRIVDGDTLYLQGGYKVRLSLVNTPEKHEIGFHDASEFTSEICPVTMTALFDQDDKQPYDVYDRLVGKITCNGKILNSELLYAGHANILKQYCPTSEFSDESWAKEFGC